MVVVAGADPPASNCVAAFEGRLVNFRDSESGIRFSLTLSQRHSMWEHERSRISFVS